jgi:lipopolysaccharide transport system ATP-binding protein
MYVRLAFAVAAHLEPEILIVDEVLAVGDAGFQKKCLGKMSEVSRQDGRTVLFVSHNMVAVQGLCSRAIWLREGKVVSDGDCARVVSDYSTKGAIVQIDQQWDDVSTAPGNEQVRIHRIQVHSTDKSSRNWITMETPICIAIDFWNLVPNASLAITLHVYTEQGIVAFGTSSVAAQGWETRPFPAGHFQAACNLPGNLLNSGMHRINLLVVKDQSHVIHQMEDAVSFEVHDAPESRGAWYGKLAGAVRPKLEWSVDCQPSTISNNHKPIL